MQDMKAKLTVKLIENLAPAPRLYKVWDTEVSGFFIKIRPSGVMTYGLYYRIGGKAAEFTIGKHGALTLFQARDVAKKKLGDVANGKDIQAEKQQARRQQEANQYHTLRGFLTRKYGPWVLHSRRTGAATLARLQACFVDLMERPLSEITPWLIEKWQAAELQRGKRPTAINRDVTALKAMLAKAVDWGVLDKHPLAKLKPLRVDGNSTVRYLSEDEETRLRKALLERETRLRQERANANQWRHHRGYVLLPTLDDIAFVDHLHPLVLLAMNTGLRRGELFNLRWGDVNLGTQTLTVQGDTSKSGQTRHIPLNDEALSVLTAWHQQTGGVGYLFPAADGGRLTSIKRSWSTLLTSAGITHFRFHDLRHHFASQLVMAGVDLNTVRELLGHADIKMTLRYAHLAPEHKAAAVAQLNRASQTSPLPH
jgi:integrase